MKIGKNMKHALNFVNKHSGWHSFSKNRPTINAIKKLHELRLIEINNFGQFRKA